MKGLWSTNPRFWRGLEIAYVVISVVVFVSLVVFVAHPDLSHTIPAVLLLVWCGWSVRHCGKRRREYERKEQR